jgi:hypothetical protein
MSVQISTTDMSKVVQVYAAILPISEVPADTEVLPAKVRTSILPTPTSGNTWSGPAKNFLPNPGVQGKAVAWFTACIDRDDRVANS